MGKVFLKRGKQDRLLAGHLWVYNNEIKDVEGEFSNGDIVDIVTEKGKFVGRGYINTKSVITVRLLTRQQEEINKDFFVRRIEAAWEYRKGFVNNLDACRVVFGESDLLPGLVVDKYNGFLCVQILTLGIEKRKEWIFEALKEVIKPEGIYERSDVSVRQLEGLEQRKGFVCGEFDPKQIIKENELNFMADLHEGQKTGYFFDQRENRAALKSIVSGKEVLDCFCHTGTFALHAAKYGASKVTGIDISELAVTLARQNAELNNLSEKCDFYAVNAFDELRKYEEEGRKFDVIILDPPAFAKSKGALNAAYRGYKEINLRAMKLIPSGGFLVTCSCSFHLSLENLKEVVISAAKNAKKAVRIVEVRSQAKDHPVLLGLPETEYLKFIILQII